MRGGGVKFFLQLVQNRGNIFNVDNVAVRVEHLHEAAHVRALKFLWQIHKHPERGDGIVHAVRPVAHLDGKAQSAHAHLVNSQFAGVALALLVIQFYHRRAGFCISRHGDKITVLGN